MHPSALFTTRETRRRDPRDPAYWIVEGFAGFVEEFRYDLRRWTVDTRNPRAGRMDLARRWVAVAGDKAPYARWVRSKLLLRDG